MTGELLQPQVSGEITREIHDSDVASRSARTIIHR